MSQECISDSEDDNEMLLNSTMISPSRMATAMEHLGPEQRLRTDDQLHRMGLVVQQDHPSSADGFQELLDMALGSSDGEVSPPSPPPQTVGQPHEDHENEHENINNLKIYLDSRNYEQASSRRGLRKRNFASTHPYLADQAHYLGLSSINYLNELYDEKQDFEHIVKYLNYAYRKQKEANPKDEKYKAKNFYTILGRQTAAARANEKEDIEAEHKSQPSQEQNFSQPSQIRYDISDASSYESDDPSPNPGFALQSESMQTFEEDYSSTDDELKDARRVPLEKVDRFQRMNEYKEQRKGLAIKKTVHLPKQANRDVFDFVDDTVEREADFQFYRRVDTSHEHMSDFDTPLRSGDTFGILSETSDSDSGNAQGYDSDSNPLFHKLPGTPQVEHMEVLSDESVEEVDRINPMFASRTITKKKSTKSTKSEKYTKKGQLSSSRVSSRSSHSDKENQRLNTTESPNRTTKAVKKRVLQSKLSLPSIHGLDNESITPRSKPGKSRSKRINPGVQAQGKLLKKQIVKNRRPQHQKFGVVAGRRKVSKVTPGGTNTLKTQGNNEHSNIQTTLNAVQKHQKSAKDLLKSDYYFSKAPEFFTTVFEAESERNYVPNKVFHRSNSIPLHSISSSFPPEFILSEIDVNRISQIDQGKTYVPKKELVQAVFFGENFTFTLINKENSHKSCERLMVFVGKLLKDQDILLDSSKVNEIYHAIKAIIEWYLIVQELPQSEKLLKLLNFCFNLLAQTKSNEAGECALITFSSLFLLAFTLQSIQRKLISSESISVNQNYEELVKGNTEIYWLLFFRFKNFPLDENPNSKEFESIQMVRNILAVEKSTWCSLAAAVEAILAEQGQEQLLDKLLSLSLAQYHKGSGWAPFIKLHSHIALSDICDIHIQYIDTVVHLNQVLQWPIEENLMIMIYKSITLRKFSNFKDEWVMPEVLGFIRSRSDLPYDSFFERFMYLVYIYVSNLESSASKKRLITKLITSSHYTYKSDREHYTIFINRLNLILLLTQLSELDLKSQLSDLIQRVQNSKDSDIYEVVVQGLTVFTEISIRHKTRIGIQCFESFINGILSNYLSIRRVHSIWGSLIKIFKTIVNESDYYAFQFLQIYETINEQIPDTLSLPTHYIVKLALDKLTINKSNLKENQNRVLEQANKKVYLILHKLMTRFPLPNINEEKKLDRLVELCFQIWCESTELLPSHNWSRVTLQYFPYLGNSKSREKFKLYFYSILIKYTPYKPYADDIIISLFHSLGSYSPSKYHSALMNQLNQQKDEVIQYQKKYIPEDVTSFHLSNFRSRLVLNLVTNLSSSSIPVVTKKIYLEEFLKRLNDEFDNYFSSSWFKEFCVRCVKAIQKFCGDFLPKSTVRNFASKLSIPENELDKYEWLSLPLKDRLISLNKEIVNHIHFGKNAMAMLRSFTFDEGVILIYHLISIYFRALETNPSKWKFIYCLLDFFDINLKLFKFQIMNNNFKVFLEMLMEISNFEEMDAREVDKLHRIKSLECIFRILRFCKRLFDGYGDMEFMDSLINNYRDGETSKVRNRFSQYRLFDIQDLRESTINDELNELDPKVVSEEKEELAIMERREKSYFSEIPQEVLEFSFSF